MAEKTLAAEMFFEKRLWLARLFCDPRLGVDTEYSSPSCLLMTKTRETLDSGTVKFEDDAAALGLLNNPTYLTADWCLTRVASKQRSITSLRPRYANTCKALLSTRKTSLFKPSDSQWARRAARLKFLST